MVQFSSIVLGLSVLASAKPVHKKYEYAVRESHRPPRKWTRVGPAPGDATLDLHIGLRMSGWDELERHISEVSDPSHKRYGQYLSHAEVNALTKPHDHALDAVHEWLESHSLSGKKLDYSAAKDWIKISIPVSHAEKLLQTKYSVFRHQDGHTVIRTPEWSLPKHLHSHIQAIQPTTSFLRAAPRKVSHKPIDTKNAIPSTALRQSKQAAALEAGPQQPLDQVCDPELVTPACLRNLYKTAGYVPKALDKNSVAFTNYLNETAMMPDVKRFLTQFRPDAADASIDFTIINNGENTQANLSTAQILKQQNAEGNLDGETLIGMVYPMKVRAYNTGGSPPFKADAFTRTNTNEPYLLWLDYMLNQEKNLPQTVSTSYGDDEQTVPQDYAELVCQRLAALGARGVTLLFASGDNGVGGDGACFLNDGTDKPAFLPSFPDSCPYVTSVGGTKNFNPEVAAWDPKNGFASGGGYSNYFGMPDWQKSAVEAYTKSLGQNFTGWYNASGRAYPDVAAQGQAYAVVWNGRNIMLDGTSASTPTMAGVVALLNDYLVSNGKPTLGFMNPWLYKEGYQGFNDILSGSARGCDGEGFRAGKGWDPVTGVGTPDFEKLQKLVMAIGSGGSPPADPSPAPAPAPPSPEPAPPAPSPAPAPQPSSAPSPPSGPSLLPPGSGSSAPGPIDQPRIINPMLGDPKDGFIARDPGPAPRCDAQTCLTVKREGSFVAKT